MPTPQYPILKVEGLTVYQGKYLAVRDVSFELRLGTNTAIVGPNGAGKSTLVQALLGLIPRTAGKIEIFNRPIERLGNLCHQIGYMPQNFIFDRGFPISVSELVGLGYVERQGRGARLCAPTINWLHLRSNRKKAAIAQALERVDAYHLRRQAIGSLSGGELKRVLLAYCLVIPRQLLILDEAFAGVDAQGAADFYTLLNELKQQENWTMLQISHDLDMVSRHCDRILCLNQALICTGTPEIALSPQNLLATYSPSFSRYHHNH
jgi:zinc/manganese transport system ATP-binding protein